MGVVAPGKKKFHIPLRLANVLFPSLFPAKTLYAAVISPLRAIFPANLNAL